MEFEIGDEIGVEPLKLPSLDSMAYRTYIYGDRRRQAALSTLFREVSPGAREKGRSECHAQHSNAIVGHNPPELSDTDNDTGELANINSQMRRSKS